MESTGSRPRESSLNCECIRIPHWRYFVFTVLFRYMKPVSLLAFGLVTQGNAPDFVPFNSTIAPFAFSATNSSMTRFSLFRTISDWCVLAATTTSSTGTSSASPSSTSTASNANSTQGFVTNSEQDTAYSSWLNGKSRSSNSSWQLPFLIRRYAAGISSGVSGLMQYQWSQGNLTTQAGTAISQNSDTTGQSSNENTTGQSPNDGYSIQGVGYVHLALYSYTQR